MKKLVCAFTIAAVCACNDTPTRPEAPPPALASVGAGVPDRAYVANRGAGTVLVVDRPSRTVVDEISVGTRPTSLAISPDDRTLLVTVTGRPQRYCFENDGSLAVISLATETLSHVIPAGTAPWDVLYSPDGARAYVSDAADAVVRVLDVASGSFIATISDAAFDTPQGMAITPGGDFIYVANVAYANRQYCGRPKAPENVTVVRTSDNMVVAAIDVSSLVNNFGPWDATVLPDGSRVFSNDGDDGTALFEIDSDPASPGFNTLVAEHTLPGGFGPRGMDSGVTPAGVRVFAAVAESDEVVVIDPATSQIVQRVPVQWYPWRVSLSPDGTELWVSLRDSHEIVVLDTSTYLEIGRIADLYQPADIVFASPATPAEQVDALRGNVDGLEDSGALNAGQAKGLQGTLNAAAVQLSEGNDEAAAKILSAFIHQVQAFENAGILSAAEGEALIEAAQAVIAQLGA